MFVFPYVACWDWDWYSGAVGGVPALDVMWIWISGNMGYIGTIQWDFG